MFLFNRKTIYESSDLAKKDLVCQVLKENHIDYYLKTKYNKAQAARYRNEYQNQNRMNEISQIDYSFRISVKKEDYLKACETLDQIRYRM